MVHFVYFFAPIVSPELKTLFDQQKDGGNIRTIKIVISESILSFFLFFPPYLHFFLGEVCETVKTVDKGVSMEKGTFYIHLYHRDFFLFIYLFLS